MTSIHSSDQTTLPIQQSQNLRVLILDDSEFDRKRLTRLIQNTNRSLEVMSCADMKEFEEKLVQTSVDICLIDHQLKGSTGLEAVQAVRECADVSDLPVVMISGHEDTRTIVQSMNAGCVDFLSKQSLTAESLHQTIFDAISSSFPDKAFSKDVRQSTSHVLDGIAVACLDELKPRLSRMYRQIAFIRSCHNQHLLPSPEALDDIEEQCLRIWRFFDEIEAYSQGLLETMH